MSIFQAKQNISYTPDKNWPNKLGQLNIIDIYVDNGQYKRLTFKYIFSACRLSSADKWPWNASYQSHQKVPLEEALKFYRCQLNFALFASTSALGISLEHLTHYNLLLRSLFRFHLNYHVRRIFKLMGVALPNETRFNKTENLITIQAFH